MKAKFKVTPNGENYDVHFFVENDNPDFGLSPIKIEGEIISTDPGYRFDSSHKNTPEHRLDDVRDKFLEDYDCTELVQIR